MRDRIENVELSIRRISEKAEKQKNCVRFDIGQPSFDTPEHVKDAAREGLEQRQEYTSVVGMDELRDAVLEEERIKERTGPRSTDLRRGNVMITTGGMGAVFSAFAGLLEKDDVAVFNDPCWGPYRLISEVNGNRWKQVEYFDEEGDLRGEARKLIEESDVVVINTPSNPTGRVLTKSQAREMGEVSEDSGTFLLSDEVYHRIVFDGQHHSPAAYSSRSAVVGSVSKNHAMTGWRIGWLVSTEGNIDNFAKVSRATTACPPKIGQIAAVEAIRNDSHLEKMRKAYRERRDLLVQRMKDVGWKFEKPGGAIYSFPDVGRDSWSFCLDMIERGVSMVPGEPFGPESDENVRICFGSTTKEEINQGFDILEDEL